MKQSFCWLRLTKEKGRRLLTTRTRIILLVVAVVLIISGSLLYQQQAKTPSDYKSKPVDGPEIDTTPPQPLK